MTAARRGRGRPAGPGVDIAQRRSDLLDAAERAIRAHGPDVGIAEVAKEAGFVRSAVYAVFPNRAAILSALGERQARRLLIEITERADGSVDLRRRMWLFFDVICGWMQDDPNLYRALGMHAASGDEMPGIFDELAAAVEAMLRLSLAAGGADTAAAAPWARAIVGSAMVSAQWWIRDSDMPRAELVEHLTTLCWDGGAALPFNTFDVKAIDTGQS
ncbi:TetR family transcriptional regulator [Mycobacterium sp. NS-7484]|uniref:TetR/AcrR family transcriptional regulator n=1 Tax=unclassified Mycobacterium TaxID=2642494 RepID=UPI00080013DB|nr:MULTISPECIES: TetR/AcrR family transcriptional regulator [unclassified Mycobacterium]OBG86812.1 TetR family transcriptional regulator [Mycobacterium sp. E802]OMC02829.1 TetR family transcriptional regulator [Mycobacterium sp. NS-7484]